VLVVRGHIWASSMRAGGRPLGIVLSDRWPVASGSGIVRTAEQRVVRASTTPDGNHVRPELVYLASHVAPEDASV